MRAIDGINTGSISGTYAPAGGVVTSGGQTTSGFMLAGGTYDLEVVGTVSAGGSVQLQKIGPDGATAIPVGSSVSSAPNVQNVTVPNGGYRIAVTSATVICGITRIPGE